MYGLLHDPGAEFEAGGFCLPVGDDLQPEQKAASPNVSDAFDRC